jgi:hypothetical protein
LAKKRLEPEDDVKLSWTGELEGQNGYLMMSSKKLLFVHESGFLTKKYDFTLDLPYENIVNVERIGRNKLILTEAEDRKHNFVTYDAPLSRIENDLKEFIESARKPETPPEM